MVKYKNMNEENKFHYVLLIVTEVLLSTHLINIIIYNKTIISYFSLLVHTLFPLFLYMAIYYIRFPEATKKIYKTALVLINIYQIVGTIQKWAELVLTNTKTPGNYFFGML